ncbi:DsrE family protein [Thiohalorhabdus sp.]|uniref:DsrE family protein n=1 Tax=Thiohalorhabdus sp. TaxID=3094134 RepID=UPI002FC31CE8
MKAAMNNVFRSAVFGVGAIAMVLGATNAQAGDYGYKPGQKAVYQVNEIDRANGALRNVGNHLEATGTPLEGNIDLAVVSHSSGVYMLLEGATNSKGELYEPKVQDLMSKGVAFLQCRKTLQGKGLKKSDLVDGVEIVPSGVGEVAEKQRNGYAYVKP